MENRKKFKSLFYQNYVVWFFQARKKNGLAILYGNNYSREDLGELFCADKVIDQAEKLRVETSWGLKMG